MAEADKAATCPHCGTTLVAHEAEANADKGAAQHCNGCGCCFDAALAPRAGHPVCNLAGRTPAPAAPAPAPEPAAEAAPATPRTATTTNTSTRSTTR